MNEDKFDPKLKQILDQLAKFGFSFYNFDEDATPLVKGPNNQIVQVNVAINFVNKQIQDARERSYASSGGPENMNTESMDSKATVESGIEKNVEVQKERVEDNIEKQSNQQKQSNDPRNSVPKKAPPIQKPQLIKPYGDGFDPRSFNPGDIRQTLAYIDKNVTKPSTSSHKWLAEQFKKFMKELNSQKK